MPLHIRSLADYWVDRVHMEYPQVHCLCTMFAGFADDDEFEDSAREVECECLLLVLMQSEPAFLNLSVHNMERETGSKAEQLTPLGSVCAAHHVFQYVHVRMLFRSWVFRQVTQVGRWDQQEILTVRHVACLCVGGFVICCLSGRISICISASVGACVGRRGRHHLLWSWSWSSSVMCADVLVLRLPCF